MTNTTASRNHGPKPHHLHRRSLLAALSAGERQLFKDDVRRHCAAAAGANDTQLVTLSTLEKGFNTHFPHYTPGPDGTLHVRYTAPQTGTIEALVHPDGTLRIQK